jgi:dihydrofolate reductase
MFHYADEAMDISSAGFDARDRDIVLGRKTYEIFEAYWPYQAKDNPVARNLNAARKHVASRTLKNLQWQNSVLLGDDVQQAIAALKKQPGRDLQIIGSANLIQSLQAASLIDEYNVWTYPVVLGRGKRLFEATAKPGSLRLVRTHASSTGVVMSTYVPAGDVQPGSFAQTEPSDKERERRAKWVREDQKR